MKKLYRGCKKLFLTLFKKKRIEYVYMFVMDSLITVRHKDVMSKKLRTDFEYEGSKEEQHKKEKVREAAISKINKDLQAKGKEIKYSDFIFDSKEYKTYYVFGSDSIKSNLYLTPLMLEIYAFKTIKKEDIFSYPFEEILFKTKETEVKIYKFKVEC